MIQIDSEFFEREGYLIVRGIFRGERLRDLRAQADAFVARAWASPGLKNKHRMDLCDPAFGAPPLPLLEAIADPWVLGTSEVLARSPLIANQYQISVDSIDIFWHRDKIFLPKDLAWDVDGFHAERPYSQIQWNLPLVDDEFLNIVPGSHIKMGGEPDEIATRSQRENRFIPEMPGALTVRLEAGDGVVYNNNLIHGVRRPANPLRRTLHWYWTRQGHADPYGWKQPDISAYADRMSPRLRATFAEPSAPVESSVHFRGARAAAAG